MQESEILQIHLKKLPSELCSAAQNVPGPILFLWGGKGGNNDDSSVDAVEVDNICSLKEHRMALEAFFYSWLAAV